MMVDISPYRIEEFRKTLPYIRMTAGWSQDHLSTMLGVSRMEVITIENVTGKMSTLEYLALNYLVDHEIEANHNETLGKICSILFDDDVDEGKKIRVRDVVVNAYRNAGRKHSARNVRNKIKEKLNEVLA